MLGIELACTQLPQRGRLRRLPPWYPYIEPNVPVEVGHHGLVVGRRGCAERDAPYGRSCVSFRCLSTPLSFLQLFTIQIFCFALRYDFLTGLAGISCFFKNFHPKSTAVKTKSDRDLKLVENARRIFKPFLARFSRHS